MLYSINQLNYIKYGKIQKNIYYNPAKLINGNLIYQLTYYYWKQFIDDNGDWQYEDNQGFFYVSNYNQLETSFYNSKKTNKIITNKLYKNNEYALLKDYNNQIVSFMFTEKYYGYINLNKIGIYKFRTTKLNNQCALKINNQSSYKTRYHWDDATFDGFLLQFNNQNKQYAKFTFYFGYEYYDYPNFNLQIQYPNSNQYVDINPNLLYYKKSELEN